MTTRLVRFSFAIALLFGCLISNRQASAQSAAQLERWLKQFPEADADKDGRLTAAEARAYRDKMTRGSQGKRQQSGVPRTFDVDPGWKEGRFPDHAVCYKSPEEIAKLYRNVVNPPTPTDGSLRIVGTGHSFMAPGFGTFPKIAKAAGFDQQTLLTHVGGGITGSARYKWEQENGIFQFDGRPTPKLLASISNAQWDVMMWGPYFQDQPEYYECWIKFCLKYNPEMKFYLSDAWPQLYQWDTVPESESEMTARVIRKKGDERHAAYRELIDGLRKKYPGKIFVLPTCESMVLAAEAYHAGELPGIDGVHKFVGGKERSLWRDHLGHLGPGFERLEGYVFYSAIYGRSPELIDGDVRFGGGNSFPSSELDRKFRQLAWKAVLNSPLSGVVDANADGIADIKTVGAE